MANDDLIYRDDLIRALNNTLDRMHDPDSAVVLAVQAMLAVVENMPAAKIKPAMKHDVD